MTTFFLLGALSASPLALGIIVILTISSNHDLYCHIVHQLYDSIFTFIQPHHAMSHVHLPPLCILLRYSSCMICFVSLCN